jgi:hypothetical protein
MAEHQVARVKPPTLSRVLDDWTRIQKGAVEDLHIRNVRDALSHHLAQLLPLPIDQLTNQVVEDARAAYLASSGIGYRPGHRGRWALKHTVGGANKIIQNLGSVVGWAVRRGAGGIDRMPFRLGRLKPLPKVQVILWPEMVQPFLEEALRGRRGLHDAFPHSLTAMRLMLQLGLREAEVLGARWEWLDRRRQVYVVGVNKSRELREIPVPDSLMDHLDRGLGPTTAVPRGLILADEKGRPHTGQFTLHPVARCGEKVGIVGLTPHRLRASFATCHFEIGTSLSQIQMMMGHKDPETTLGYIVQRPIGQVEAQERASRAMGF